MTQYKPKKIDATPKKNANALKTKNIKEKCKCNKKKHMFKFGCPH